METLSIGIECDGCKMAMAEYTLKDENGKVVGYLCTYCADILKDDPDVKEVN